MAVTGTYTTGQGIYSPSNKSDLLARFGDTATPENRLVLEEDQFGKRIITQATGKGLAYQRFLYVTPDGKNFSVVDRNQVVAAIKKEYKDMELLRTSLYRKGKLTEKSAYPSGPFFI